MSNLGPPGDDGGGGNGGGDSQPHPPPQRGQGSNNPFGVNPHSDKDPIGYKDLGPFILLDTLGMGGGVLGWGWGFEVGGWG